MNNPEIKVISLSNVYTRLMYFAKKGDVENGHKHTYDHATLVSSGSVMFETLDDLGNSLTSKVFVSPNLVYVPKNKGHRITALEDNTVCGCIHAIRTIDQDIVSPEFLIDPLDETTLSVGEEVFNKTNKEMEPFIYLPQPGNRF
jgi:quercetin dioxygenase-like cupin family protein